MLHLEMNDVSVQYVTGIAGAIHSRLTLLTNISKNLLVSEFAGSTLFSHILNDEKKKRSKQKCKWQIQGKKQLKF